MSQLVNLASYIACFRICFFLTYIIEIINDQIQNELKLDQLKKSFLVASINLIKHLTIYNLFTVHRRAID